MAGIVDVKKLVFFGDRNYNVLLKGRHGVGKTALVYEAFTKMGLKFRIYSAATMDPWVDFIGVPREQKNGDGEPYLDLLRPKDFQNDEVEAIFMDEYNRAPKKIRNAVMELVQFKSINGRKFNNLRFVWAAINPDDDDELEYDVETIDPAQLDRFQIHLELPYRPNRQWFEKKFGADPAKIIINWWGALSPEVQKLVSPRRLEYTLDIWQKGGHLEDVLPTQSNIAKLRESLRDTPIITKLNNMYNSYRQKSKPIDEIKAEARKFLADDNNFDSSIQEIAKKPMLISFFTPLMPDERISSVIQSEDRFLRYWRRNLSTADPKIIEIMQQIIDSGSNKPVVRELERSLKSVRLEKIGKWSANPTINADHAECYSAMKDNPRFEQVLAVAKSSPMGDTHARNALFSKILESIPTNLNKNGAVGCLEVINELIKRSHNATLKKWDKLMSIINTCVSSLLLLKYDFSKFKLDFSALTDFIIQHDGFYLEI